METNEVKELTPIEEILEIVQSKLSDQQIRDALDDYHENDICPVSVHYSGYTSRGTLSGHPRTIDGFPAFAGGDAVHVHGHFLCKD